MKLVEHEPLPDRRLQLRRRAATRSRIAAPTTTGRSASATGTPRRCTVACPRHGASFDLATGRALSLPAYLPARTFPVRVEDGGRRRDRRLTCRAGPLLATSDAGYLAYHDEEWGRPVRDERGIYERLCLEGFQSGLSWLTILRKRPAFRRGLRRLRPRRASPRFGEADVERLLADAGIVRHRGKIEAAIANARATRRAARERRAAARRSSGRTRPAARPAPRDARATGRPRRRSPTRSPRRLRARGLPLRRADDGLRRHAGMRRRERPPRRLPGARRRRAGAERADARRARPRRAAPARGGDRARGRPPACRRRALAPDRADERRAPLRALRRPARLRGARDRRLARLLDDLARRGGPRASAAT